MAKIDKLCATTPPTAISAPAPTPGDVARPAEARGHRVKLPKLTLRPFNGDITTWTTFWDSYESAIHKNPELSDIDKFNYLKSLLERTAQEAISGLTLTSVNYHEAISILKKRFGNKQQIVARHMDILLNADPVTSQHNLKGLRHLYDLIEAHVRSLKSLGVSSDSYGSLLSSVLLSKLPQELRLLISRTTSEDDWTLAALMGELEKEIKARERAAADPVNPSPPIKKQPKDQHTAAALVSVTPNMSCCYCQQPHPSDSCGAVVQVGARKQILKKSGRCFVCLRRGHISRECRSRSRCPKCGGRHHFSICSNSSGMNTTTHPTKPATTTTKSDLNPEAAPFTTPTTTCFSASTNKSVLLQTARSIVYDPDAPHSNVEVRAILDPGSQRSYVTTKIKDALSLRTAGEQQMSILTFGSNERNTQTCQMVRVGMRTREGPDMELELFAVPLICEPLAAQPISICKERYDHLMGLELADNSDGVSEMGIDVLIGSDYYWEVATGRISRGQSGPIAVHTRLGWILSGPVPSPETEQSSVSLITTHTLRVDSRQLAETLDDTLRSFWDLESLGIKDSEQSVFEKFKENIAFKEGRYEVSLPWKEQHPLLPDNYLLSVKRLHGLLRRLQQNPSILQEYDRVIQNQLKEGIVEKVEETRATAGVNKVHYLPHHAVVRQDKQTTKLRIVYDASAKCDGPSLNECLYMGPKFDQSILDILLRFRTHQVALTADIEKAFLMVTMAEPDRDVLRFLWVDDIKKNPPEICAFRFTRVVFGVSSSPFLLNATIQHHLEEQRSSLPHVVEILSRSTYVDDIISGAGNEQDAYQLYTESKDLLRKGGFGLRKFVTNSSQLQERIDARELKINDHSLPTKMEETYAKSTLGTTQTTCPGEHKVLGVRWDVGADQFIFDANEIAMLAGDMEPTKRHVVAIVGKFYDPLGYLAPTVIQFKMFFQELCRSKLSWDHVLEGGLLEKWKSLVSGLRGGPQITIPRCYLEGVSAHVESYSLHGFCDASQTAYAAVVYLAMETPTGKFAKFVASKTRVAPLQGLTIPRLELLSGLLLAKLMTSISTALEAELDLNPPTCYTDSMVALYWIVGVTREWKQFVENRVQEIRKLLPVNCWKHCSGRENPADLPSRGLPLVELSVNKLWRNGPDWLTSQGECENPQEIEMPKDCTVEMKSKDRNTVLNLLTTEEKVGISQIINCEDYSSTTRLFRTTAYVLRFVDRLKGRGKSLATLTAQEISRAESLWVKESQRQLAEDRNFEGWKTRFGLFLDQTNLWRCGGRLSNADIPYSTKHPILLPRSHHLTTLIVKKAHESVLHNGVKETLTQIRSQYWIIRGRSLVRMLIHKCAVCRRFEGRSYTAPPPPPLPRFRVTEEPPFTHTGVDFAGPLYVRSADATGSRKVWICLYTCCVVRAIHLDIVQDMTTSAFLRSLKRFTARRGLPRRFVSDNGKTFKSAAKLLSAITSHDDIQQYLSGAGIEWTFNVEKAPWWGGIFERMVRSIKRCLKKMIGRAQLSYDEILTAVTEVESIINSRPLSYVSTDDLEEPLTPSHFLTGRRLLSIPDRLCIDDESDEEVQTTPAQLSKRMRHLNRVLNQFWKRWKEEYLLELRDVQRCHETNSKAAPISVGDVVVVHDDKPRGFWKLAKVEEVITGRDGQIRGAVVRVTSGKSTTVLRRPLQRLYPMEISGQTDRVREASDMPETLQCGDAADDPHADEPVETAAVKRPTRAAAIEARDKVKAWAVYDNMQVN